MVKIIIGKKYRHIAHPSMLSPDGPGRMKHVEESIVTVVSHHSIPGWHRCKDNIGQEYTYTAASLVPIEDNYIAYNFKNEPRRE